MVAVERAATPAGCGGDDRLGHHPATAGLRPSRTAQDYLVRTGAFGLIEIVLCGRNSDVGWACTGQPPCGRGLYRLGGTIDLLGVLFAERLLVPASATPIVRTALIRPGAGCHVAQRRDHRKLHYGRTESNKRACLGDHAGSVGGFRVSPSKFPQGSSAGRALVEVGHGASHLVERESVGGQDGVSAADLGVEQAEHDVFGADGAVAQPYCFAQG